MSEKVFLNDKLIDASEAAVPASDTGFLYGAGLFETMRSRNGVVFALEDHLERLFSSAVALSMNNTYTKDEVAAAVAKVLDANELTEARLRITLTNGPMIQTAEQRRATLLISATNLVPYPPEYYQNGVLAVLSRFRQNASDPTTGHKTTSYYPRLISLSQAHSKGATEALWFTVEGYLAEGCVSNVFLVKDSALHTPGLDTPVLPGIARKTVCSIAGRRGYELVEKNLTIDDCLAADEMFLTNSIMHVMPVSGLEKHTYGDGKPGPVTRQIMEQFDEVFTSQTEQKK